MRNRKNYQKGLYRARDGVIAGVCKGLARYFDFSVFWVRFIALLGLLFTGLWPILGLYILAALIMKPAPAIAFTTTDENVFYDDYVTRRASAVYRVKHRFDNLDRRIRRMEDRITSKEYDWETRMHT